PYRTHHSSFRDAPPGAGPESITTIVSMDSGLTAARRPGMTMGRLCLRRLSDLVLCLRLKVTGIMALVQLARGIALNAVDHAAALHRGALRELVGPALHVLVFVQGEDFAGAVNEPLGERAVPRPGRHVGDGVLVACKIFVVGEPAVEHVHLPLHLHGVTVDGIFDFGRRIGIEVAEAAAEERRRAHLPEQPGQAFGAGLPAAWNERPELFGEMHQDRAGLEEADRRRTAAIHQRWNLGVGIDRDKAAAELVAVDPDQPGIVFGTLVAGGEQLLEHHGDLDAVGRSQRVELEGMSAYRQFLVMGRTGDRAVDSGEAAAAFLVPGPDFRGFVGIGRGRVGHSKTPDDFYIVIASEAKQSIYPLAALWIASSLRSSQ